MKLAQKIKVTIARRELTMKNEAFVEKFTIDNEPVIFQATEEAEIGVGTLASPDGEFIFPDGVKVRIENGAVVEIETPEVEIEKEEVEEVVEPVNEEVVEEKIEETEEVKEETTEPDEVTVLKDKIVELEAEIVELKEKLDEKDKEIEEKSEEIEKKEEEIKEAEMVMNNYASFGKSETKKSNKKSFNLGAKA